MKHMKPLAIALLALVVVGASSVFILDSGFGLGFFYSLMGNQVYAVVLDYQVSSSSNGYVRNVMFNLSVGLERQKIPVERVLLGFRDETTAQLGLGGFVLTLCVSCVTPTGATVYSRTFTYRDADSRKLTCFLSAYDSRAYPVLTVRVTGNYNVNGTVTGLDYGQQFTN